MAMTTMGRRLSQRRTPRVRQRGVMILLFMLVAVSASAFFVLRALNGESGRAQHRQTDTVHALRTAREALLGYAVSYAEADGHAPTKGPGHLPRPDLEGEGAYGLAEDASVASPYCSGPPATAKAETGLFPFRALGLSLLTDGAGAPLWYAVSCKHRSVSPSPLNSETPGLVEVDGASDIVAVVIAPGPALEGQARDTNGPYSANDYLEGDNTTLSDGTFASRYTGVSNDTVVTITRAELAAAIERRVIGEVASALRNYYHDPDGDDDESGIDPNCDVSVDSHCDDGFPWLAPAGDPTALDAFIGRVEVLGGNPVSLGHLPLMQSNVEFEADFEASWFISGGILEDPDPFLPPSESCIRNSSACAEQYQVNYVGGLGGSGQLPESHYFGDVNGSPGGGWQQGLCTVIEVPDVVHCTATREFTLTSSFGVGSRSVQRKYVFEFASNIDIAAPTAIERRSFQVVRDGIWTGADGKITITDKELPSGTVIGTASLTINAMSPGDTLSVTGIPFDLEMSDSSPVDREHSPGAMPRWFYENQWHHLVFVQYALTHRPGDTATECAVGTDCLRVGIRRPGAADSTFADSVGAVVLAAGPALTTGSGQARPSDIRANYLEGANASVGGVDFDLREAAIDFNDRVLIVEP